MPRRDVERFDAFASPQHTANGVTFIDQSNRCPFDVWHLLMTPAQATFTHPDRRHIEPQPKMRRNSHSPGVRNALTIDHDKLWPMA